MPNLIVTADPFVFISAPPGTPGAVSADFGYGYGTLKGQIGESFASTASNLDIDLAYGFAQAANLGTATQDEGTSDYFFHFEGTGGFGSADPSTGEVSDPNSYLNVALPLSLDYLGKTYHMNFEASVSNGGITLIEGEVSDAAVDFSLDLGSAQLTFDNGDKLTVTFSPVDQSSNGQTQQVQATFLLEKATITGGPNADLLLGTPNDDTMQGLGGNDVLVGSKGADLMDGGTGIDVVRYDAWVAIDLNTVDGSLNSGHAEGDTYVSIQRFVLSKFSDEMIGDGSDNYIDARAGNDILRGNDGADSLIGGAGEDSLYGGAGNDRLDGVQGDDVLRGEDGNDVLLGGTGYDTIVGGAGRDVMRGQDDADVFDINSILESGATATTRDFIVDFKSGADVIDLSTIDADMDNTDGGGGNQHFTFIGTAAFTGADGQLRIGFANKPGFANDRTYVVGDVNGGLAGGVFQIELFGIVHLTADDFVL